MFPFGVLSFMEIMEISKRPFNSGCWKASSHFLTDKHSAGKISIGKKYCTQTYSGTNGYERTHVRLSAPGAALMRPGRRPRTGRRCCAAALFCLCCADCVGRSVCLLLCRVYPFIHEASLLLVTVQYFCPKSNCE